MSRDYPASGAPWVRVYVKTLSLVAWAVLLAALLLAGWANYQDYRNEHSAPTVRVEAPALFGRVGYAVNHECKREDSFNCYWNARTRANHTGHSFYAIRMPGPVALGGGVCIFYWNGQYGRRHNHCEPMKGWRKFRSVNGHPGCWIKVGPTSRVWCRDGYRTTS